MSTFTEFLAAAGGVLIFDEIKKRLLDKLFFSLPEEEQNRIIIEVIKEMNSQADCGEMHYSAKAINLRPHITKAIKYKKRSKNKFWSKQNENITGGC